MAFYRFKTVPRIGLLHLANIQKSTANTAIVKQYGSSLFVLQITSLLLALNSKFLGPYWSLKMVFTDLPISQQVQQGFGLLVDVDCRLGRVSFATLPRPSLNVLENL